MGITKTQGLVYFDSDYDLDTEKRLFAKAIL